MELLKTRKALSPLVDVSRRPSPEDNVQHQDPDPKGAPGKGLRRDTENRYKPICDVFDDSFVWKKKIEKEGLSGLSEHQLRKIRKRKIQENLEEVAKVKRARQQRLKEWEERRQETEASSRKAEEMKLAKWENAESEWYGRWEEQEEHFFLQQAQIRTQIRLKQGRGQPIDHLANYIQQVSRKKPSKMKSLTRMLFPETYVDSLGKPALEDLLVDVDTYKKIHVTVQQQEFWDDVKALGERKLAGLAGQQQGVQGLRGGIHRAVMADIKDIVDGKTFTDLCHLEENVRKKLRTGDCDVSYWETVLKELVFYKAKSRLSERHLAHLRADKASSNSNNKPSPATDLMELADSDDEDDDATGIKYEPVVQEEIVRFGDAGAVDKFDYDVCFLDEQSLPMTILTKVRTVDEDLTRLHEARQRVLSSQHKEEAETTTTTTTTITTTREGPTPSTSDNDVIVTCGDLNEEIASAQQREASHSSKLAARKPRYCNKVFTGFAWNRYNRTHYDSDHPPPKMVTGYRFNIFYPDLIDKTERPQYTLTSCADKEGIAVLRFSAGPPYQDLAFQIVDKEWDKSCRHGYRCTFNGAVLQLWFRFKRNVYRR